MHTNDTKKYQVESISSEQILRVLQNETGFYAKNTMEQKKQKDEFGQAIPYIGKEYKVGTNC